MTDTTPKPRQTRSPKERAQSTVDRLQRMHDRAVKRENRANRERTAAEEERKAIRTELDHAKQHPALRQDQRGQEAAEIVHSNRTSDARPA